jgi:hypothetical protein
MAAGIDHRVDRRRATQSLAAWLIAASIIQAWLWRGRERPIVELGRHRKDAGNWRVHDPAVAFYSGVADAAVSDMYVWEVVCSKRTALFEPYYQAAMNRLSVTGKTMMRSTLAHVVTKADRNLVQQICAAESVKRLLSRQAWLYGRSTTRYEWIT